MDFEKEYNEMVQRARELHEAGNALTKKQMETVCPQLAESEDERIRKALVTFFIWLKTCDGKSEWNQLKVDDILTYLGKQKEEKHATIEQVYEKFLSSDTLKSAKENKYIRAQVLWELIHNGIVTEVDYQYLTDDKRKPWTAEEYRIAYQKGFEMSEQLKQKEQKPTSFNESYNPDEYEVVMEGNATSLKRKEQKPSFDIKQFDLTDFEEELVLLLRGARELNVSDDEIVRNVKYQIAPNLLAFMEKGQKPVEYLPKQKVFDIMNKLTNLSYSERIPIDSEEYVKIHEITSDVNSLLDYPIKPAEWSDEDERILQRTLECLSNGWRKLPTDIKQIESWLKSFRPQPQWKPSEEQIEALQFAVKHLARDYVSQSVRLSIMYDNLKKLM